MDSSNSKWLQRLEAKMDKADLRSNEFEITMTEIKIDLRNHMSRTAAVEKTNEILKEYVDAVKEDCEKRLSEFDKFKDRLHFLGWLLAGGAALIKLAAELHLIK